MMSVMILIDSRQSTDRQKASGPREGFEATRRGRDDSFLAPVLSLTMNYVRERWEHGGRLRSWRQVWVWVAP